MSAASVKVHLKTSSRILQSMIKKTEKSSRTALPMLGNGLGEFFYFEKYATAAASCKSSFVFTDDGSDTTFVLTVSSG